MIIWTDGELEIRHPAKCRCGYCKLKRSSEQSAYVQAGAWQDDHRTWRNVTPPWLRDKSKKSKSAWNYVEARKMRRSFNA